MKKITLLLLVIAIAITTNAQPPRRQGEGRGLGKQKLEMYKIQFITKKLSLTPAEAEAFWPIYEAQKKVMKEIIETKSNEEIQLQEAILSARKKFKSDLKPVLKSEERVNDALKIEREFLKKMRSEMNRRKGFRA
jgi:Spy/CpxP family protein refolding chaperone